MTRDMLRIMAQVETLLLVLENRLRQTEEALVTERRASRRTAEVTQQVSTWNRLGDSRYSVEMAT